MNLIHVSLAFIVGFLLGGMVCYFAYGKLFSKHQLQDELTSTRRELANSKRALNDFFVNADSQFVLLDKNFRQFASMMAEAASRLNQSPDLFDISRDEEKKGKAKAAAPAEASASEDEDAAAARENAERAAELKKDKEKNAKKAAKTIPLEKPAAAAAKEAAAEEAEDKPAPAEKPAKAKTKAVEESDEPAPAEPPKDFVVEEKTAVKTKI